MLVVISDSVGDSKGSKIVISSMDTMDYYENLGIPMYNELDDDTILPWFDGKTWIFPKPVLEEPVQNNTSQIIELLESIDAKLNGLENITDGYQD